MNDREICVEAVRQFGRLSQIIKALEEMGELSQALARWLNGAPEWDNIIEEIVDVGIMLEQLDYIVRESRMGTVSLDEMKQRKIARLAGMLDLAVAPLPSAGATSRGASFGCQPRAAGACPLGSSAGAV